jgi:hypothetical protein
MKKHVNGFREFLNERENETEEPARDEAKDLKRLKELGMIGQQEYIDGMLDWAERSGQDTAGLFEPGEIDFDLQLDEASEEEEDTLDGAKEWLSSWTGSKGEFVISAKGLVGDEQLDLDLTLSSGAQVHFEWNAYDSRSNDNWILVKGRRSIPYEETMEEIEDEYGEHEDWETYMHERLSAIVDSSYEG